LTGSQANEPDQSVICGEESRQLNDAIAQLPDEQREVIILHLKGEMKFREIARLQGASISTIQGRYRYGLDKLRSLLDGEVEK
jgi:RNA polymerase sigma-70 factor (ECF subfamily)